MPDAVRVSALPLLARVTTALLLLGQRVQAGDTEAAERLEAVAGVLEGCGNG